MSAKGMVDNLLLPGLHQGRVMAVGQSRRRMAYCVTARLEAQVVPESPVHIGYTNFKFEIPFSDVTTQWEFGLACGIERPLTRRGNLRRKYMVGRRPLMLIRSDPGVGLQAEVMLFLRCSRELQWEKWTCAPPHTTRSGRPRRPPPT